MTTKEKIEVMQAFEDGKQIQYFSLSKRWEDTMAPIWDWSTTEYRIKPEPTYRPYKSTEEMIADFKERFEVNNPSYTMPLIWVKNKKSGAKYLIEVFYECDVRFLDCASRVKELFDYYTYLDGSLIGKLVE